jgi:hypothetical protein
MSFCNYVTLGRTDAHGLFLVIDPVEVIMGYLLFIYVLGNGICARRRAT